MLSYMANDMTPEVSLKTGAIKNTSNTKFRIVPMKKVGIILNRDFDSL